MKSVKMFLHRFVLGMALWLFGVGITNANIINISLDANDWELRPDYDYQSPNHSITNTGDGLQAINEQSNPGSPWGVVLWTVDTYNVQNAVVRYKWKAVDDNGSFSYASYTNGFHNWVFGQYMTTSWSWAGSHVIPFDTWIYAEALVADDLSYYYNFSTTGYASSGGFRSATGTVTQDFYDSLAAVHMHAGMVDNYSQGAGFVVNEMYLEKQQAPNNVPEPAPFALLALSMAGLAFGVRRCPA